MSARLRTVYSVLIAAAALAWALSLSGCACCPATRAEALGQATPHEQCAALAPSTCEETGRGAAEIAPTPRTPSERAQCPPAEEARTQEIAPGPAVRAAMPLGPVPQGEYLVQPGDSLWSIAARAYHDPYKWRDIYDENRAKIHNPNIIYPNQALKIPRER